MKNKLIKLFSLTLIVLFVSAPLFANEYMTGDDIKVLFSDKTYDIHNLESGKKFRAYNALNGKRLVDIHWKNKVSKRKWWVDGNQYCGSHPKKGNYCRDVKDGGNGVYYIFYNDKHIRTFSNLRNGKDSDL